MDFEKIVKERYATKNFIDKKISQSDLNKLLEIIRYSPSSFNIQPWKIIVIENKNLKDKLSPVSWNQSQIKSCSHLLVFCADKYVLKNIENLEKIMIKNGAKKEQIKNYIDMMKDFEKNLNENEKLCWAQRQVYIALGNALNGAKSLGFDSCPMEGFNSEEYSKILELPKNLIPTVLCPIGYSNDKSPQKIRFSEKDIFVFK